MAVVPSITIRPKVPWRECLMSVPNIHHAMTGPWRLRKKWTRRLAPAINAAVKANMVVTRGESPTVREGDGRGDGRSPPRGTYPHGRA